MRKISFLLLSVITILWQSCSSSGKERALTGEDVIRMINNYETDSLRAVMDKAFIMDFDNISFQGNATTFLEEVMTSAKSAEAYYEVVEEKKAKDGNFQYIVKDHSAFDKYFQLEPPQLLLSLVINDSNRFEKIYIDSLPGYKVYDEQLGKKFIAFDKWLEEKYPDNRIRDLLQDQTGKMVARLKEFNGQVEQQ